MRSPQELGQPTFDVTDSRGDSIIDVKDNGTIGIGTPSPQVKPHILETGTAGTPNISTGIPLVQRSEFGVHSAGIGIISGNAANATLNFGDTEDDNIGQILYNHDNNSMRFKVNNGIRLSISGSGNVGIGADPHLNYKLLVNGDSIGDAWKISDLQLKQNIATIQNALDQVIQLRGVNYEWRVNEHPELNLNTGTETGLIAQEVMTVLPGAVSDVTFRFTGEEGLVESEATYYAMSYRQIIPVLVEATKEQQAIINEQNAAIEALETRMAAVEAALQRLNADPPADGNP